MHEAHHLLLLSLHSLLHSLLQHLLLLLQHVLLPCGHPVLLYCCVGLDLSLHLGSHYSLNSWVFSNGSSRRRCCC